VSRAGTQSILLILVHCPRIFMASPYAARSLQHGQRDHQKTLVLRNKQHGLPKTSPTWSPKRKASQPRPQQIKDLVLGLRGQVRAARQKLGCLLKAMQASTPLKATRTIYDHVTGSRSHLEPASKRPQLLTDNPPHPQPAQACHLTSVHLLKPALIRLLSSLSPR